MVYEEVPYGCDALIDQISDATFPIGRIAEHLAVCKDCQRTLDWALDEYQEYQSAGRPKNHDSGCVCNSLKWIPAGFTRDNFLQGWRLGITKRWEVYQLRCKALEKMYSPNGAKKVQRLLRRMHQALTLRAMDAPKTILADQLRLLEEVYAEMQKFFGSEIALADYLGLDADNAEQELQRTLEGWKKLLGM